MAKERILPLAVASELDATSDLTRRVLDRGNNKVGEPSKGGLRLIVRATPRRKLTYRVVDSNGDAVATQSVRVTETGKAGAGATAKSKTTCWECGVDSLGDRHCWKVPCPDIVGPWIAGKLLAVKF